MTFPYTTKAVKAWIITGEQRPEVKHAVKLIAQSPIDRYRMVGNFHGVQIFVDFVHSAYP